MVSTIIRIKVIKLLTSLAAMSAAMGCATAPQNLDDLGQDREQSFYRTVVLSDRYNASAEGFHKSNAEKRHKKATQLTNSSITFSRGDLLRLNFDGMASLNGLYQITGEGYLDLPFADSLSAVGESRQSLQALIKKAMVRSNWFYEETARVDVSMVRMAPIEVAVFGAVFNPGRVSINDQPRQKQQDPVLQNSGVFDSDRNLISAINASGGVRPDANLSGVYLKRGGQVIQLSLSELLSGGQFAATPTLINGDTIFVSSRGRVNKQLIRPSQITPPGMRVFMSNLTAPALTNAQSAIGADATRLPYGSSLLDSAISANCIGGTHMANASRSIVLVTRNHGSKEQLVIRRTINQLLADSSDMGVNPYVMPNDGVACYDSKFTNFRDVARGIGELVSPIILGGLL